MAVTPYVLGADLVSGAQYGLCLAAHGSTLAVASTKASTHVLSDYSISGVTATQISTTSVYDACSEMTFTPAGDALFVDESTYGVFRFDPANLTTYFSPVGGQYGAVATNGTLVAIADYSGLVVKTIDGKTVYCDSLVANNSPRYRVEGHGLGLAADGSALFMLDMLADGRLALRIFDNPARPCSAITTPYNTMIDQAAGTFPIPITLDIHGRPDRTGHVVTVSVQDRSGTHTLPSLTTAADGTATLAFPLTVAGDVSITFGYSGDAASRPTTSTLVLRVMGARVSLTVKLDHKVYNYKANAAVQISVGATTDSRRVVVTFVSQGRQVRKVTADVPTNAPLKYVFTVDGGGQVDVEYLGDTRHEPATASGSFGGRVNLSENLTGQYKTSRGYAYFHVKGKPALTGTVRPNQRGKCLEFIVQIRVQGTWQDAGDFSCVKLGATSKAKVVIVKGRSGLKARMRFTYSAFQGGYDATVGAWKYFTYA